MARITRPSPTPNHSPRKASGLADVPERIAVVGGGAWGTALAISAARAGRSTTLWVREADLAQRMRTTRENDVFLPGHRLPPHVTVHEALGDAVRGADAALLVVPSQHLRATCKALARVAPKKLPLVICAKGIEHTSGLLMAQVVEQCLPDHPLAVLSGPTFASEVAQGQPTAVTLASEDAASDQEHSLAARLAAALGTPTFRPYVTDDLRGVEVGGAVKNVLAIASGIAQGLGFGANARAALITRGLEEVRQLTLALGGRSDTVYGLAGLGDLSLTCSSEQSRNMRFGMGLAAGRSELDIFDGRPVVVEGRDNVVPVTDLARRLEVEMPICEAVRAVVAEGAPIGDVMVQLLSRPFRAEARGLSLQIAQPDQPVEMRL
ncbi:NAD(P)H-dependent glycerol-3-phosphate dehydrogenase [Variovorax dokdonensis]|uniref:Glycerol-3-phosphate dehydrogenase [NAD(P)+] n=1 Tax=Variovorax dokdonensis TaxID=344883 RepID=A0ABT7NAD3_9BURK|nr:NAD(P)H-dependent glycerol-3-phosphate dehydrogenase [Variovorax dokdonensis]MDM0044845.1 NAD(P)H-dependent glycerol-3-phosphate dehydrogenase [Variovorax dokdonensis]